MTHEAETLFKNRPTQRRIYFKLNDTRIFLKGIFSAKRYIKSKIIFFLLYFKYINSMWHFRDYFSFYIDNSKMLYNRKLFWNCCWINKFPIKNWDNEIFGIQLYKRFPITLVQVIIKRWNISFGASSFDKSRLYVLVQSKW